MPNKEEKETDAKQKDFFGLYINLFLFWFYFFGLSSKKEESEIDTNTDTDNIKWEEVLIRCLILKKFQEKLK